MSPGGVGVHRAVVLHRFQIRITRFFRITSTFLSDFLWYYSFFYLAHGELWYLCHLKNDDEEKKQGGDELPTYLPVYAWVGQVWPDILWFSRICEGFWKPPGRLPSMAYTSSEKFLRTTISDHGRHQPFLDHITLIHRTIKIITTERANTLRHKHWQCLPESIEPADCDGLCEDCDEEGEAGCVRFQQVEDVETAL